MEEFVVMNTHFESIFAFVRIKFIDIILEKQQEFCDIPFVLIGDFNTLPSSSVYKKLADNFYDAQDLVDDASFFDFYTFHDFVEDVRNMRLDYIFLSKNDFKVNEYKVMNNNYDGAYSSDHFPVLINAKII